MTTPFVTWDRRLASRRRSSPVDSSMTERQRAELFARAAELLWGRNWQTPLAEALDVDPRTVRRWVRGGGWSELVPGVLADQLRMQQSAAAGLIQELERL